MYQDILRTLKWFVNNETGPFKKAFDGSALNERDKEKIKTAFIRDGYVEEDEHNSFGREIFYAITIEGKHAFQTIDHFQHMDAILKYLNAVRGRYASILSACTELKIPFSEGYEFKLMSESMIGAQVKHQGQTGYHITERGKHFIINSGGYVHQYLLMFNQTVREYHDEKRSPAGNRGIHIGTITASQVAFGNDNRQERKDDYSIDNPTTTTTQPGAKKGFDWEKNWKLITALLGAIAGSYSLARVLGYL